jgi:large subunit ribosomal protein L19
MRHPLFDVAEKKYQRSNELEFQIGETVVVTLRIVEGSKERLQDFEGTVIARKGEGLDEMFTVRRLVGDEGVERTFPLHSPRIVSIKTTRTGKVRRCKLYFLRDRVGKARRLREKRISAEARAKAAAARAAKAKAMQDAQEAVARAKSESADTTSEEMAGTPT